MASGFIIIICICLAVGLALDNRLDSHSVRQRPLSSDGGVPTCEVEKRSFDMGSKGDNPLPFEIKDVEPQLAGELMKYHIGELTGFVQVGPKRYFLPNKYKQEARNIYNAVVRPDDTFLLGYPRSGTTWSQEMVWLVANDLDYAKAKAQYLGDRFPFLESTLVYHPKNLEKYKKENEQSEQNLKILEAETMSVPDTLAAAPSPRFLKTHLPLSLLPPALLDTARVIFVARDPRDVAISYYHLTVSTGGFEGDFKTFWNYYIRDMQYWSPFFENVKEAWDKRDHPNMLFLFYENMTKDLPAVVRRVAEAFGKSYSDEEIQGLCEHLAIDNFKNNKSVNNDRLKDIVGMFKPNEQQDFIRKGKSGGWRDYLDEAMQAQAQQWITDNLRGSDLRFPGMENLKLN